MNVKDACKERKKMVVGIGKYARRLDLLNGFLSGKLGSAVLDEKVLFMV